MYNPEIIDILLRQKGRKAKDLAKALSGNERQPLTSITKKGANPTAETLEKVADFFLVSLDTLFIREVELPKIETPWTIEKNRPEYFERTMIAKDHLIKALNFEREMQEHLAEARREEACNLLDEVEELKALLRQNNIPIPRHQWTEHPINFDDFVVDGHLPEEAKAKYAERARLARKQYEQEMEEKRQFYIHGIKTIPKQDRRINK